MRRHPTRVLAWALVFVAGCGTGELGSMPSTTTSETTTGTESAVQATTTTDKPELTVGNLPATTVTSASGSGAETTTSTTESVTGTTSEPSGIVQVPQAILSVVIEDAANKENLAAAAVTVLSGKPVDWSDGSLGCPEPGMSYTQVITPGYLVVIDAGGVILEYHLNQQGAFKQCTGGTYYPPSDY